MTAHYYHGSPDSLSEIRPTGVFGGVFASSDIGVAKSHGSVVHVIESPHPLTDFTLNYETPSAWDTALAVARGNEDIATRILDAACPQCAEMSGDDGWELQRLRGVLAARLGYTSVEMHDEHGTTYLCLPGCSIVAREDHD